MYLNETGFRAFQYALYIQAYFQGSLFSGFCGKLDPEVFVFSLYVGFVWSWASENAPFIWSRCRFHQSSFFFKIVFVSEYIHPFSYFKSLMISLEDFWIHLHHHTKDIKKWSKAYWIYSQLVWNLHQNVCKQNCKQN